MASTIEKLARTGAFTTVVSGVSHATPGSPVTVAFDIRDHVGRKVAPTAVIPVATAATEALAVTAFDADGATVISEGEETAFDLIII